MTAFAIKPAHDASGYVEVRVADVLVGEVWRLDRQEDGLKWAAQPTGKVWPDDGQEWFATRVEAVRWLTTEYSQP